MATDAIALLRKFHRQLVSLKRAIRECSSAGPEGARLVSADFCDRPNEAWQAADDGRASIYRSLIAPHVRQVQKNGEPCSPTPVAPSLDRAVETPSEGGDVYVISQGPQGADGRIIDVMKGLCPLFASMDERRPFAGRRRFHPLDAGSLVFPGDHVGRLEMTIANIYAIIEEGNPMDSASPKMGVLPAFGEYLDIANSAFHALTAAFAQDGDLAELPLPPGISADGVPHILESRRTRALRNWESEWTPQLKSGKVGLAKAALQCGTHAEVAPRADRFETALTEAHRVMEAAALVGADADPSTEALVTRALDRLSDLESCEDLLVPFSIPDPWPAAEALKAMYKVSQRAPKEKSESFRRFEAEVRKAEAVALTKLAERDVWNVDELPPGIDLAMLRCLDAEELIEARAVVMQNVAKAPSDPAPPVPAPQSWVSPIKHPEQIGGWDVILTKRTRSRWEHPWQVRVSERGHVELARIRRSENAQGRIQPGANDSVAAPVTFDHADDFTWIIFSGDKYDFTKGNQSESIRALWESWDKSGRRDGCGLSEKTIGAKCGSAANNFRLAQVLRGHPAFGTVIRSVTKGVFALFQPESPENPTS